MQVRDAKNDEAGPDQELWVVADMRGGFFEIDFSDCDTGLTKNELYEQVKKFGQSIFGQEGGQPAPLLITRNDKAI